MQPVGQPVVQPVEQTLYSIGTEGLDVGLHELYLLVCCCLSVRAHGTEHSPGPSVGWSVSLSVCRYVILQSVLW